MSAYPDELRKIRSQIPEVFGWPDGQLEDVWEKFSTEMYAAGFMHATTRIVAAFREYMGFPVENSPCPFCNAWPHHKSCNHAVPADLDHAAADERQVRKVAAESKKRDALNESNERLQRHVHNLGGKPR